MEQPKCVSLHPQCLKIGFHTKWLGVLSLCNNCQKVEHMDPADKFPKWIQQQYPLKDQSTTGEMLLKHVTDLSFSNKRILHQSRVRLKCKKLKGVILNIIFSFSFPSEQKSLFTWKWTSGVQWKSGEFQAHEILDKWWWLSYYRAERDVPLLVSSLKSLSLCVLW